MSEEIFLEGKTYVSSKRAADETGYAQDYIGQLARKGLIDAQRVGGLWYVSTASLTDYQKNAASYIPQPPVARPAREIDSVVTFDGKDYVSASRAAKLTGYNQDYIGQLARGGKILSRQIGNRWYVDRDMLLSHKSQKDALLAAVQAESVGLIRPAAATGAPMSFSDSEDEGPVLTYITEGSKDLMPVMRGRSEDALERASEFPSAQTQRAMNSVPIRRISPLSPSNIVVEDIKVPSGSHQKKTRASKNATIRAAEFGVALTFVIVLSYGWTTLKANSTYTANIGSGTPPVSTNAFAASAANAANAFIGAIENLIAPTVSYQRQ